MELTPLLLLTILLFKTSFGVYQPGTPGAPWTEKQALVIRAKLLAVWSNPWPYILDVDPGTSSATNTKYIYDPNLTTVNPDYSKCEDNTKCDNRWQWRIALLTFREPKAVRLAFHDCVGYKDDPKGGCDGCLNFDENR